MWANFPGVEFVGTITQVKKEKEKLVVVCQYFLHNTSHKEISCCSRVSMLPSIRTLQFNIAITFLC